MADLGYESASVVFLISRVGTGKQAQKFVEELGNDPIVGTTVYVSKSDLALKRSVFERVGDDEEYTRMVSILPHRSQFNCRIFQVSANHVGFLQLIQLFLSALQVRERQSRSRHGGSSSIA